MRMPKRLAPLVECGVITRVVRSLLSGKEAQVYLVESDGHLRAAKVYKDQAERSFRNRSSYTEGRAVRNSRDRRAMAKRSRHGREQAEANWITTEADAIYKLATAGVRVPKPHAFVDGVLVMECVMGSDGGPAPRLADCSLEPARAELLFQQILREIIKMLCADTVHGDLSVYNVLIEPAGPVIIDFPQVVDAASNTNARDILLRDVANITSHFKRGVPASQLRYGHEMWDLYEKGELRRDTILTGMFALPDHLVDAEELLAAMRLIEEDEVLARQFDDLDFDAAPARGQEMEDEPQVVQPVRPGTRVVELTKSEPKPRAKKADGGDEAKPKRRRRRRGRGRGKGEENAPAAKASASPAPSAEKPKDSSPQPNEEKKRRRRRRKGKSDKSGKHVPS